MDDEAEGLCSLFMIHERSLLLPLPEELHEQVDYDHLLESMERVDEHERQEYQLSHKYKIL